MEINKLKKSFIKKFETKLNKPRYKILKDKKKSKIEYRQSKYGLHITINNINWNHKYTYFISKDILSNKEELSFVIEVMVAELDAMI